MKIPLIWKRLGLTCWYLSSPITLSTEQAKNMICVYSQMLSLKNAVELWLFLWLFSCVCILRHMHSISFTYVLTVNVNACVCLCVHRCALIQVFNSETPVVKPQRSTGICEVSYSRFVIRCKTLTDLLRQQKNQNQLGDVTHCLLIFICDSNWLHERYQGIVSWWWRMSQWEKSIRQERFGEINGEGKGNRGAESAEVE